MRDCDLDPDDYDFRVETCERAQEAGDLEEKLSKLRDYLDSVLDVCYGDNLPGELLGDYLEEMSHLLGLKFPVCALKMKKADDLTTEIARPPAKTGSKNGSSETDIGYKDLKEFMQALDLRRLEGDGATIR